MKTVKLITSNVNRRNGSIVTIIGELTFDENGVSNEVSEEAANEFISVSEGSVEIYDEKNGNFKVEKDFTAEGVSDEKKELSEEALAELKIKEDAALSKELAKKTVDELKDLAKLAEIEEADYIKLTKVELIKLIVSKQ